MRLPTLERPWIWILLTIAVAVAAIVVAFVQYRRAEMLGISKYMETEYEPVRNIMIIRWKKDHSLANVTYDLNGDLHADSIVHYGSNGTVAFIERDADFDGRIEELFMFNRKGELIIRQLDTDEDRYTNEMFEYFKDSIVHYNDRNEDGHFMLDELVSATLRTDRNAEY
ncbi:MAG: hypothetical protein IPN85_05620 [Flavobacteriales bacterium]|nr:hypothetical protein [Flavobacteriales bacterium]MBL0035517.1 hypothetical protein [Flavobacteriales bacterium]